MVTLDSFNESRKIEKDLQVAFSKKGNEVLSELYLKISDLIYESGGALSTGVDFDDRNKKYFEKTMAGIHMAVLQKVISRMESELALAKKTSPLHWFQITSVLSDKL